MKLAVVLGLLAPLAFAQLSNEELERRINILSEEITNLKAHQMGTSKNESVYGLGNSASKVYFIPEGISIGSYGEIVYTRPDSENESGDTVQTDPTAEALRFIIYLGYKFNDKWVFNSELEIEHVNEVYNEFMYLDYLHSDELNARFGLMLLPVGFLNELHEPTLFPSVKRPLTEKYIIPTTWREIGAGVFGSVGNIDYKAYLLNGGDADGLSPEKGFRGARKKGGADGKKNASTAAVVGRVDYNFNTQTSIGASLYTGDASSEGSEDIGTTLYDVHAQYGYKGLRLRFLYSEMSYDNVDEFNALNSETLQEKIRGGYVEALYNVWAGKKDASLSPFVRYERINLNAEGSDAFVADGANDFYSYTVGVAYSPLPRLVFKADYAMISNQAETGVNEFNLGMGFNF
ncbi:MAG: hypothetical protein CME64_01745 [Halobacteriovoraceae bacterium]|nr:hypothetical protein [Halobacteriovoraceae bacterium]